MRTTDKDCKNGPGMMSGIVMKYYLAYETKDREVVEALLTTGFLFSSPLDDHISREGYFEKCWPNSVKIRAFHIHKLFEAGSESFVLYDGELYNGVKFHNTEFIRFEGDKIAEIEVFFGSIPGDVKEFWDNKDQKALSGKKKPGAGL
jgi:hypothetical protein